MFYVLNVIMMMGYQSYNEKYTKPYNRNTFIADLDPTDQIYSS